MEMIEVTICGKRALVPVEHKAKILRKEALVAEASAMQKAGRPVEELQKVMGKIIRLNRQIPPCVQFI